MSTEEIKIVEGGSTVRRAHGRQAHHDTEVKKKSHSRDNGNLIKDKVRCPLTRV
jgi:hypothetical protein